MSQRDSKVVAVVGCTHAGTFAAQSILAQHPNWTVDVFERNDNLSFLSCGIALWAGDHVSDPKKMFYSSPEQLAQLGARMHMKTNVLSVDVDKHTLTARDMRTDEVTTHSFDKLVVTTGSKPVIPPVPGLNDGIYGGRVLLCKNWDHGVQIKESLAGMRRVAIVGAGYIGAELAEQLSVRGHKVVLIDGFDRVLAKTYDEPITDEVEKAYVSHGVELVLGQFVQEFAATENGVCVKMPAKSFDVDFAIVAAGFEPRTDLFAGQLETLANGALRTDRYMRAYRLGASESSPDVLAAGDAAAVLYNPTGTYDYIPLATNAVRQALLVGANIAVGTREYAGTQATSAVQLYDLSLAATGLTQGGANARGIRAAATTLVQDYRPDFMLTTTPVIATLVWDPDTHRILGAQFCCRHDITEAANAVSIAIQAGFTIEQLAGVDLFFQPNFCQPVNFIGALAMQAVAAQGA